MHKLTSIGIGVLAIAAISTGFATPTHAQTASPMPFRQGFGRFRGSGQPGNMQRPGVFGKVTAINDSTLTVDSTQQPTNTQTTYTIDASKATIMKNNAAGSLSDIAVGDNVMIRGTISGSSVAATEISDDQFNPRPSGSPRALPFGGQQGNGQPIIAGTVTAVSGSTITLTNKGTTTYTIDATNAKVSKNNKDGSISDVAVGDSVIAQGTVNGNNVTAVSVIDQAKPTTTPNANNPSSATPQKHMGFFGGIGQFFMHLFGF